MTVELVVFGASALVVLAGAVGVVASRNPVHSALSLVATLFGVAVLFVELEAHLLAAVQVIVYAGAIVILFLFVIMLLGVDRSEDLSVEPLGGQRPLAVAMGAGVLGAALIALVVGSATITGRPGAVAEVSDDLTNVEALGRLLFTDYVAAFEITGLLLTIAVVAAVLLARIPTAVTDDEPYGEARADDSADDEPGDGEGDAAVTDADHEPEAVDP